MFLKKTAIITLSSLFLTVGCISISSTEEAQQIQTTLQENATKISELEAALSESEEAIKQKQTALEEVTVDLEKTQKEKTQLAQQLKKKKTALQKSTKINNANVAKAKSNLRDKTTLGQTEWIYVSKAKQSFRARIDTGAATSSINAIDIQEFERDGKDWVKFNITHEEDSQEKIIEAPVLRYVRILQSSEPGEYDRRPVVELNVRIGGVTHKSEFTLTDRMHMDYAVLIGRSFIQDVIVVDVSQDYIYPKYQEQDKK